MNIYLRELKAHRKALIIWSISMIIFVIMGMQKYRTLVTGNSNPQAMLDIVNAMPKFLQAMWGTGSLDMTTPVGYFGILLPYLVLMGGIHASMIGTSIIYKEERDKTVEFLMAKPVSRKSIITSKIMAALTNIIVFNIVTYITSVFVLKGLTSENITNQIVLSMISTFFIQLLFMVVGITLASVMKHPKKAGSITMAILIGTFFLSWIVGLSDKLELLGILSPFKYFEAKDFFKTNSLNIYYLVLIAIVIFSLLKATYYKYERRDLNI